MVDNSPWLVIVDVIVDDMRRESRIVNESLENCAETWFQLPFNRICLGNIPFRLLRRLNKGTRGPRQTYILCWWLVSETRMQWRGQKGSKKVNGECSWIFQHLLVLDAARLSKGSDVWRLTTGSPDPLPPAPAQILRSWHHLDVQLNSMGNKM